MSSLPARALVLFVVLLAFCLCTHSAPLDYRIIDPSRVGHTPETDTDIRALEKAKDDANKQIEQMHTVVQNYNHPVNKLFLIKSFGQNYNFDEIKKNVGTLKSSTVNIQRVRDHLGDKVNAATSHREGNPLRFDHKYYTEKTDRERAGTLIHEAAHALFNAHDHFTNDANPSKIEAISSTEDAQLAMKGQATLSGKINRKNFNMLKAKASHAMHMNADSYKVLGHFATYGLHAKLDKGYRIDNTGIPDDIVHFGGSVLPVSEKFPVSSQAQALPQAKAKELSPNGNIDFSSNVAKNAHDSTHVQNSQRKNVDREKPLPPVLNKISPFQLQISPPSIRSPSGNAHDSAGKVQSPPGLQTKQASTRSQSRQGGYLETVKTPSLIHPASSLGRIQPVANHPQGPARQGGHPEAAKIPSMIRSGSSLARTQPVANHPQGPAHQGEHLEAAKIPSMIHSGHSLGHTQRVANRPQDPARQGGHPEGTKIPSLIRPASSLARTQPVANYLQGPARQKGNLEAAKIPSMIRSGSSLGHTQQMENHPQGSTHQGENHKVAKTSSLIHPASSLGRTQPVVNYLQGTARQKGLPEVANIPSMIHSGSSLGHTQQVANHPQGSTRQGEHRNAAKTPSPIHPTSSLGRTQPLENHPHGSAHQGGRPETARTQSMIRSGSSLGRTQRVVNHPQSPTRLNQGGHHKAAKNPDLKHPSSSSKVGSSIARPQPVEKRPGGGNNHPQGSGSPPRHLKTPPQSLTSPNRKPHKR